MTPNEGFLAENADDGRHNHLSDWTRRKWSPEELDELEREARMDEDE